MTFTFVTNPSAWLLCSVQNFIWICWLKKAYGQTSFCYLCFLPFDHSYKSQVHGCTEATHSQQRKVTWRVWQMCGINYNKSFIPMIIFLSSVLWALLFPFLSEPFGEQTVGLLLIWDALELMWLHCNIFVNKYNNNNTYIYDTCFP